MNKKNTKRALLLSTLALLVCLSMLVGSTFAWFTDSVVSANNIIKSGNLDVTLEYKTNWSNTWADVESDTKLFAEDAKFEPGYTEVVFLRVANAGSLALKYELKVEILSETTSINMAGEEFKLSDYLEIGTYVMDEYSSGANYADILFPAMFGSREAALSTVSANMQKLTGFTLQSGGALVAGDQSSQVVALVLNMPETVGNEANHKTGVDAPKINLGVTLLATQLVAESDSFGPEYDEDATYPTVVNTAADLATALAAGKNVTLGADVALSNEALAVAAGADVVIDLGGNTLSAVSTEAKASAAIDNKGTLTLKNGTVTYEGVGDPNFGYGTNTINNSGKLVIDGATIINTTASGSSVAIDCSAGADLTVNSGVIKSVKNAIRLCPFGSAAIKCTINGGEITGARAIQIHLPSNKPAEAPDIDLTINGGTLSALDTVNGLAVYSYSYGQSFANVDVAITGGTFNGHVAFGAGAYATQENVTVTGGTFNGELGRYLANDGWEDIAKP